MSVMFDFFERLPRQKIEGESVTIIASVPPETLPQLEIFEEQLPIENLPNE